MLYRFLRHIVKFILHILFRFKIKNLDVIPKDRAVLICSNHISILDFALIGGHVKTPISYLGKAEIGKFKPFAAFLKALGFIPIKRGKSDINAIKNVITTIEDGRSLLMFPQGTRKRGEMIEKTNFKHGASLVQRKAACDVVPVSITAKGMKIGLFKKITINFGDVIPANKLSALTETESTELIKEAIIHLAGEAV